MNLNKIILSVINKELLIRKYHNPKAPFTIEEILDNGHEINPDGTIWLYHSTTKEKAEQILKDKFFKSPPHTPDSYGVYFSTSPDVSESYGDGTLIKALVRVRDLYLDDVFPGRDRLDFHVKTFGNRYKPVKVSK